MSYKSLKTIFHMYGLEGVEQEYKSRINSFSTYLIDLEIHPIQDEKQKTSISYPLFFTMTKKLTSHLETVLLNTEKIKTLSALLPGVANHAYMKHLLINELQSTNETENIRSTKQEIAASINKVKPSHKRFDGLVSQYMMMNDGDGEINVVSDIRRLFDKLVSTEIKEKDMPDGVMFRTTPVGVHDGSRDRWVHRNVASEQEIIEYLQGMLTFIKYDEAPRLFKMMASHFIFEYIHPFYDGNGRVGRYILAKLLHDTLDPFTALTFSYTVNRNKSKYNKAFENTSHFYNKGELTTFIEEMLDLLIEGQQQVLERFEHNNMLLEKLSNALENMTSDKYEYGVLFILLQDKIFGSHYSRIPLKQIENVTEFSRNKINDVIQKYEGQLVQLKRNPAVYELSDRFIESLLTT
ncbi:Fic family protein [Staphylococcus sp. IVB6227]|uniref:Fic family protein n=1 Tax=Staphylococcus sp. IVB6227 TaxID=2989768 RepID=UPI0021CE9C61|nr:Fic family protein [Staphylococcus sp. IVB6227]UXR78465.1 Fic family protein [Staphylococcus sp. IVB6227]